MNIVEILEECKDMIIDWGSYADEYFKEKYDFDADIKQLDDWIAEAKERML